MKRLRHHAVRIVAFAWKEIREVVRQPRLVLSLIVGPFLILGLFALGFEARPPALRTVLVLPADSELADRVGELEESLQPFIEVVGITQDVDSTVQRLIDREIDLVVVAPSDAFEIIRRGEHATIDVIHTRLDPFDQANIEVFARTSIDELNRTLLAEVARVGQERVEESDDALPAARSAASAYSEALRSDDDTEVRRAQLELDRALLVLDQQLASTAQITEGLKRGLGAEVEGPFGTVGSVRNEATDIDRSDPDAVERAAAIEASLAELDQSLDDVTRIPPEVAMQPFVPSTRLAAGVEAPMTSFYAPAVMIVLIQHLSVTFAALSVVRETTLGSDELFRVGPTTVTDIMFGKYLGYMLIAGSLTTTLVLGLVFVLGVPMVGSWGWLALVLGMVVIASFALGFLIAAFSESEAQAVQFSMLSLLFTIFFSGLVLPLDRITELVRGLAFTVPATPGIASIQDVMFRGDAPRASILAALGVYLLVTFVLSTLLLRRRYRT